jgi:hypothetical protein
MMIAALTYRLRLFAFAILALCGSCANKKTVTVDVTNPALLDENQKQLTRVIIYDVFTPPVASRIYAYTSLASYEAVRFARPGYTSIAEKLNGFPDMPKPDSTREYNYALAASKAFFTVAHKVVFSVDTLKQYEEKLFNSFQASLDEEIYKRSVAFGESVGEKVLESVAADNYKKTRGMAKYLGSKDDGKWQPTAPDYLDGVEPYWGMIRPLALDSSCQVTCPKPPAFNKSDTSIFYKHAKEVYDIGKNLTDSQITIIQYWDDNPFVIEHKGHLMFANKKITPGGHWMGIASIACRQTGADLVKTAQVHALTSIALLDGFIACWDEKYKTEVVRPITVIHHLIDDRWEPYLQTPPFPEYPSGHSVISAAAATVLTHIFGEGFRFHDDSDKDYIGMERDFSSFMQAADEAAISRVYGGIHYRSGMEAGAEQGRKVGKFIINKLLKQSDSISPVTIKTLQASAGK